MGSKMVKNICNDGHKVVVFDANASVMKAVQAANQSAVTCADSVGKIGELCDTVISMLPNDAIVESTSRLLLEASKGKSLTHISCSTVSPATAKSIAKQYADENKIYVSAPVFARPDGIQKKQAIWMVSGDASGRQAAAKLLESSGRIIDFGDDTGSGNVVKLCGNFLIASSIESISEAMALAEKNGVDRKEVMKLLSSTIFDCLIFKGYGQRVSERDHRPGGFSLELGLKDVSLVNKAARDSLVPMPFLSVLLDRYTSAKAKGRSDFDWSAIGISAAEDAGIDVSKDVQRNREAIDKGETY